MELKEFLSELEELQYSHDRRMWWIEFWHKFSMTILGIAAVSAILGPAIVFIFWK